uniref:tail fiber domain-containing protein n=1 Tax=Rhizobium fredii TaxID=380 RepID=UPI0005B5413A
DRAALETRLANQGLQPGSEAYNRAIDQASRQSNDARISAILNAGQEQSRLAGLARDQAAFQNAAQQQQFGQNVTSAGFGNDARQQMYQNQNTSTAANNALKDQSFNAQQAKFNLQNQQRAQYLNEQYAQRNQPINEIIGLMSGAQVNSPSFVPTQSNPMPTVDYAGLVQQDYANKMGAYNAQQANMQSMFGGLLGFGGQLASLSDKRAKKDIKKVGELKGHGLYEYSYRGKHNDGKKHIGVMAQEVEKKRPDVVSRRPDGLRQVNYGALFNAGRRK